MGGTTRQKIIKEIEYLKNTVNPTDTYRTHHPTTSEDTFFSIIMFIAAYS